MAEVTSTKVQKAGMLGFWLLVPLGVSCIIGLIVNSVVHWLSMWATTMLVYAVFTLWVIGRNKQKVVRISLTLVNLVLFAASGYIQWDFIKPQKWPLWTSWIGMVLVGAIWIGIFILIMAARGKRVGSVKTHQGISANGNTEGQSAQLLDEIKSGQITADVKEQLLAVLRLAGTGGDLTFNAKQIMEQLGLQSVANDRKSRIDAANSIMEAMRMGIYDEEQDGPVIKKVIRMFHQVPDTEKSEADDGLERGDFEESSTHAKIVWS